MADAYEKPRIPTWVWPVAKWTVIVGFVLAIIGFIALWMYFAALGRDVPSVAKLKQYEPPLTSRVHAGDGTLIAEFAAEHRVVVPYQSIPEHGIDAFQGAGGNE